jgi:hypothetical protein
VSTFCAENQSCTSTTGSPSTTGKVESSPDPNQPDAGFQTLSMNVGSRLDCLDNEERGADWFTYASPASTRTVKLTYTLKRPAIPLEGTIDAITNSSDLCFGGPAPFTTKAGKRLSLVDGEYRGVLPDCDQPNSGKCISARRSVIDLQSPVGFDIVIEATIQPGLLDPRYG